MFGLLGTLVGGLITWFGQWHSSRVERRRQEIQLQQQRADLRRQAYLRFLNSADEFQEHARDITAVIGVGRDGDVRRQAEERYLLGWRQLNSCLAEAQIAGPRQVSEEAGRLYSAAAAYSNAVDNYIRETPQGNRGKAQRESLEDAMIEARRVFAVEARQAIDLDH